MGIANEKRIIAFDIETIPNRAIALPDPDVKTGNLKDPAKIKEKIEAAKTEQVSKMSLDPWLNLICCFGWHDYNGESGSFLLKSEDNEKELIQEIWEKLNEYNYFVTFNGLYFDVPTIKTHSLLHRVRPAVDISTRKYTITNHYDVRAILGNWDQYAKGTLDTYLQRILGRSKPETISGELVSEYWDIGAKEDIAKYCEGDALDTWDLFQAVYNFFL